MMRLPHFAFHAPRTVARGGGSARGVAGRRDAGRRRHRSAAEHEAAPAGAAHAVGLRRVAELRARSRTATALTLGAGLTLTRARARRLASASAYAGACGRRPSQIATPHLRNMGTLGGNLCLDTRCNYYDQNYEWRKAIDFCMKKDGAICWVATVEPEVPGGLVDRHRAGAAGARRDGHARQRRRHARDRRQRSLSQRRHRLPDAADRTRF